MEELTVSDWIDRLKAGQTAAAEELWRRYVGQLVRRANRKLAGVPQRVADAEDVALSAFHAFLRGADEGRFSRLSDRDDLWQILVVITDRKAIDLRRRLRTKKIGGGRIRGESALRGPLHTSSGAGIDAFPALEPSPEFAVLAEEQLQQLLAQLGEDIQRRIAVGKLENRSNEELAEMLGVGLRTIERKLRLIRRCWQEHLDE